MIRRAAFLALLLPFALTQTAAAGRKSKFAPAPGLGTAAGAAIRVTNMKIMARLSGPPIDSLAEDRLRELFPWRLADHLYNKLMGLSGTNQGVWRNPHGVRFQVLSGHDPAQVISQAQKMAPE